MSARALLCCLLAGAIGCGLELPNGELRCSPAGQCPSGTHCAADDRCWRNGADPDLAIASDGGEVDGGDDGSFGPCGPCATMGVAGCVFAAAGTDPNHACSPPEADQACVVFCDGNGQCEPPMHQVCNSICTNSVPTGTPLRLQALESDVITISCDDQFHCTTSSTPVSCGFFACDSATASTGCANPCQNDEQCIFDHTCSNGSCKPATNTLGAACDRDTECATGYCSPGQGCEQCAIDADCPIGNSTCSAGLCMNTCPSCMAEGLGDGCTNSACSASTVDACLDPSRPNLASASGECTCYLDSMAGFAVACPHGEVCSAYGLTDPGEAVAHCAGVAGQPCAGGAFCASGSCANNACPKADRGLCRSGAECLLGNCVPTSTSGGRTLCQ